MSIQLHKSDNALGNWLFSLRRYMSVIILFNLFWEFGQLPLYTIWNTGTIYELLFAALHCTGGDALIALSSIMLSLLIVGTPDCPITRHCRVIVITVLIGFSYTIFSEWLNIEVRKAWEYAESMPVIPVINIGLSPALQWIVIPLFGFWWARHPRQQTLKMRRAHV